MPEPLAAQALHGSIVNPESFYGDHPASEDALYVLGWNGAWSPDKVYHKAVDAYRLAILHDRQLTDSADFISELCQSR